MRDIAAPLRRNRPEADGDDEGGDEAETKTKADSDKG